MELISGREKMGECRTSLLSEARRRKSKRCRDPSNLKKRTEANAKILLMYFIEKKKKINLQTW